ncbi:MAG TPA: hypothetical protein VHW01_04980 [Polyangiaceae bacterium]|jgi:hypothetical protein|nr:hypothetical protein [Polyangiaceae bacterium]
MSLLRSKKFGFSALAFAVLALAAAQGCSSGDDDNQATPTGGTTSTGGAAGHAGTSTSGGSAGHAGTSTGGNGGTTTAGTGGAAGATETGMAGEGGAVDCNGPDGCYNCAPTNDTQFLNHCVAGGCQPAQDFHLPATLPALP